jgi:CheY-like chemotaxis protein/anti-sigma regulatory factor (Ser/Thr protein kinase)
VAILGYADVLLEELPADTGRREAAERIRRQGEHLLALVDDLLDLVRLDRGELEIRPHEASLREVVEQTCQGFLERARAKGLEFAVEVRRNVPARARFDPVRVAQVLRHLVDNAVKFTPNGSVTVRLRVDPGDTAVISVADTGPGVSPARFEELCGVLVQGDDSLSRGQGGCGVGLALARGIAQSLGGQLTCQGGAGRGTRVRFGFPLEPLERARAARPAGTGPMRGRVLLVEDAPDNRVLIRRILERVGLTVEAVEDGVAGVEAALHGEFDLVLMDIQMPRKDGLAAARELREHGFDAPILALTANRGEEWRERCLRAGCDDYLAKPVDRMALLERIARLLGGRKTES